MAKVAVRDIAQLQEAKDLAASLTVEGPVRVRPAFDRPGDPIHFYAVDMETGGFATVDGRQKGCLAYVFEGAVDVGGRRLDRGSILVIEHGAAQRINATPEAATLLIFAVGEACATMPTRAGGHVHGLASGDVPRCEDFYGDGRVGGAVLADAACPGCELWLHESSLRRAGSPTPLHSHNEDEIIVVIDGEVVLGARTYGRGAVVAVSRDTLYAFKAGEHGLTFINFRPARPIYVPAQPGATQIDERDHYLQHMPAPVAEMMANAA